MNSKKQAFVLYFDMKKPLNLLTDADRGRLFSALFEYAEFGVLPDFSGELCMAFEFVRTAIDRDAEKWSEKSRKRAESGRIGGERTQEIRRQSEAIATFANQNEQNQANQAVPVPAPVPAPEPVNSISVADKPHKHSRFVPPTVDEVAEYCSERRNSISPQRFVDFYASKNWMIGKSKMHDWKASVRTWERNDTGRDITTSRNYIYEEGESL